MSSPANTKQALNYTFSQHALINRHLIKLPNDEQYLASSWKKIKDEFDKIEDGFPIKVTIVRPFTVLAFYMNQIVEKLGSESEDSLFRTVQFKQSFIANCEKGGSLVEYQEKTGPLAGVPFIGPDFQHGAIQVATEPSFPQDVDELSADRSCMYYVANKFVRFAITEKIDSAVRLRAQHHRLFTMTNAIKGITTYITRSFADARYLSNEKQSQNVYDLNMGRVVIVMGLLMDYQMDRYLHALAVLLESTGSSVTIYYCTTKVLSLGQQVEDREDKDPNGFPKEMTREYLNAMMSDDHKAYENFHGQSPLRQKKEQILFDFKKANSYAFAVTEIDNVQWKNDRHLEMTMPVSNLKNGPEEKSIQIHRGKTNRGLFEFAKFLLSDQSQETIANQLKVYQN